MELSKIEKDQIKYNQEQQQEKDKNLQEKEEQTELQRLINEEEKSKEPQKKLNKQFLIDQITNEYGYGFHTIKLIICNMVMFYIYNYFARNPSNYYIFLMNKFI